MFGDIILGAPSYEGSNLAPKADFKVGPPHRSSHVCTNETEAQHPSYLHGHVSKPWVHLGVHGSKCKHLKEIPKLFMGYIL